MNDRVNVQLVVPEIEQNYNIYLPINKKIYEILELLVKAINELSDDVFPSDVKCRLINSTTREIYDYNSLIYSTDIRNGTQLVLLTNN